MRPSKQDYYLDIAEVVSERSTCLRRRFGAVIVATDDRIISTGYNGSARGMPNCSECGHCQRESMPHGIGYDSVFCSVHAEANAIIAGTKSEMQGATLYLSGFDASTGERVDNVAPCNQCIRLIANAGIRYVVCRQGDMRIETIDMHHWISHAKDLYRSQNEDEDTESNNS